MIVSYVFISKKTKLTVTFSFSLLFGWFIKMRMQIYSNRIINMKIHTQKSIY